MLSGGMILRQVLETELGNIASDTSLLRALLASFPQRIKAVHDAAGGHTDF